MRFCDFKNKNILITGASSGLGRDLSILLSKLNANVCLIGRDKTRLEKTKSLMQDANHEILSFDLCNFEIYEEKFTSSYVPSKIYYR